LTTVRDEEEGPVTEAVPSNPIDANPREPTPWRVATLPNLVSVLRLLGVPLFLYLLLVTHNDAWAIVVLAIGGGTDWVDGFLARRLGQVSRFGELLDPFVDRLYIVATLLALTARGVLPWWFTLALLLREAVLVACLFVLRHHGYGPPPVHYVGKAATFILLFALPVLLLAEVSEPAAGWAYPSGWALAWWALILYWIAGGMYLVQVTRVVREARSRQVAAS
jgi:cardiolipin synthase